MTNEELKEKILELGEYEDSIVLEGNEFADGVVGITTEGRVVYSYERLVERLATAYGSTEEAIEWLETNTIPSLGWMGAKAPILIHEI